MSVPVKLSNFMLQALVDGIDLKDPKFSPTCLIIVRSENGNSIKISVGNAKGKELAKIAECDLMPGCSVTVQEFSKCFTFTLTAA